MFAAKKTVTARPARSVVMSLPPGSARRAVEKPSFQLRTVDFVVEFPAASILALELCCIVLKRDDQHPRPAEHVFAS